ncbi:hypothetical protein Pst134EA_003155 [Puccinia striiformis f. sp. tritici]|uniref:uncharacterized protein n=1 Tax=Puccinia striiformis f. sp. tritici TaxID=168172 RepID=UPI002008340A|nr:uncharacterized protein Pst134EA_031369 [Puccinia striiformis f. sp. tritici]XP_047812000.1 hypothetical protein Pst134EA_003155 [Puccinia striiformis f. sp. tritici]KAH9443365.1 hypothetical protein Pst134EA_031369 [Puccinia striiformis f. sp. tritici]KAH9464704.1 hypothetical protein Pst134EB_004221 [Puccinia striiformis f. sp. tritici]KAH9472546.1 hypothetical protein Pst134EA_003155 [Puccinia striiformis f. sp. tritici]
MQLPNVVVFEDGKVSFFVGTILMTAILGANLGLFIRYWQCHKYHPLLLNISVSALVVVATAYVSMSQYAMWIWFIDPLNVESGYALWPYAISPLLSGALIWGVQIILVHRLYALSDQRFRVITVLLICLTFAQLVLCACRTMEILGIRADSFTSTRTSGPYVFPIWLTFVSLANSILNMLLFQVLNRLKFRFEMSTNLYNRFIILAPQTHLIAGLLCQLDMALFMLKKDMTYIAIDLCLGNIHLFSLLLAMNLEQVGRADASDVGAPGSRKSRRFTISDLNIEIPMNPLSARLSRTRLSSDWAETFLHSTETASCPAKSEKTIKASSSSSSSCTGSRSSDLKAFAIRR